MNRRVRLPGTHLVVAALLVLSVLLPTATNAAPAGAQPFDPTSGGLCQQKVFLCVDPASVTNYEGQYIGHDEPSLLFYSDVPGSGSNYSSTLTLPKDPPVRPNQRGTAGTWNFQLHPAFWYGMALCDSQSAPEYTPICLPNTDANIFDGTDPNAPNYIGRHPGGAYMELQFYPPGWAAWPAGNSCDATKWCAALAIFSFSLNQKTNVYNNSDCLNRVGAEPGNFAFITLNGHSQAPANPLDATLATFTPDPSKDLFMNSGDAIRVHLSDTGNGLRVVLDDVTSGQSGSMTASPANGFGQVVYAPTASTCSVNPYAFHPMYATSSPKTRLTWTAHSYNVAFSDEIGHFEYCPNVAPDGSACLSASASDPGSVDADDNYCFSPAQSLLIPIGGCVALFSLDSDFDGVSYGLTWPGTIGDQRLDRRLHATPITFTSLTFNAGHDYARVAFETDLPRIEDTATPSCNLSTGTNCVNPPPGAQFYPIFVTATRDNQCVWQEGGPAIPEATNTFGGSSTTEYGTLLTLVYPGPHGPYTLIEDFRRVLASNPCPAG